MKTFLLLFVLVAMSGCYGLSESSIKGTLTINPRSGWTSLEFVDAKTKNVFQLQSGTYNLNYKPGIRLFREPMIEILDANNKLVGYLGIPKESLNKDKSFEIYVAKRGNTNSFNILGGMRTIYTSKTRYSKLRESCTYTVTVSCKDSEGKETTCQESRSGEQDQLWERVVYKNVYRILFDGADLVNVAVFTGEAPLKVEDNKLTEDTCQ